MASASWACLLMTQRNDLHSVYSWTSLVVYRPNVSSITQNQKQICTDLHTRTNQAVYGAV